MSSDKPCLVCSIPAKRILRESVTCFSILDRHSVTPLHTLIISKRHIETYFDLKPDELRDVASHTGIGYRGDFASTRDAISSQPWREPFAGRFVGFFELPAHFLPAPEVQRENHIDLLPATKEAPIERQKSPGK